MKLKAARPSMLNKCHYCFGVIKGRNAMGYFVQAMRRKDPRYRSNVRQFCGSRCIHFFYRKPSDSAMRYLKMVNHFVDMHANGRKFSARGFVSRRKICKNRRCQNGRD